MGPLRAPTGVLFWTGPLPIGERVVHGLIIRFGGIEFLNDNASHLAVAPLPTDGCIIHFGEHRVYVAVIPDEYPSEVLTISDSLPVAAGASSPTDVDDLCSRMEVIMASIFAGSHANAATPAAGQNSVPTPNALQAAVARVRTHIPLGADTGPIAAAAEIEIVCQ